MNTNMNKYLDEIGREKLLTEAEEQRLSERIKKGDERALNRLVEANLRFVVSIARQYQGQGLSMDDLVSEGNIGLMKAARNFDASRGIRFVGYAVVHVRRQIEKALKAENAVTIGGVTYSGGNTAPNGLAQGRQTRSVDAPLGAKNNMSLLSVLADANVTMADERLHSEAMERATEEALDSLQGRESTVINAWFGIGQESLTMAEIAEDMGLKRERVRQIRDRAIRRLRKAYKRAISL